MPLLLPRRERRAHQPARRLPNPWDRFVFSHPATLTQSTTTSTASTHSADRRLDMLHCFYLRQCAHLDPQIHGSTSCLQWCATTTVSCGVIHYPSLSIIQGTQPDSLGSFSHRDLLWPLSDFDANSVG